MNAKSVKRIGSAAVLALSVGAGMSPAHANSVDDLSKLLSQACPAAKIPADACKGAMGDAIKMFIRMGTAPGKVLPKDGVWEMPLFLDPGQKSRVSSNFGPLTRGYGHRVQFNFVNVRPDDLAVVRATVLADKQMRNDQPRSPAFANGETVEVLGGGKHDRGFYIARIEYPAGRAAFFLRNPNAMVIVRPVQSWKN